MSKLIGTNPNQVPSNADLGSAAFMDAKDFLTARGSSLSAIDAVIPKTAVDVFIYDTSKDSDGGAWRKRTQDTSWYNEPLNTTIRGSRREFPAVAVIVVTSVSLGESKVIIYDADDPTLPMWMELSARGATNAQNATTLGWFTSGTPVLTTIFALNGILTCGLIGGINQVKFVSDSFRIGYSTNSYVTPNNISQRDNKNVISEGSSGPGGDIIIDYQVNDVAMTVLPNAPIDDATGLPIPTIAVATAEGVSVIKDDGTVVDLTSNQNNVGAVIKVGFIGQSLVYDGFSQVSGSDGKSVRIEHLIPSSDVNITTNTGQKQNSDEYYTYADWDGDISLGPLSSSKGGYRIAGDLNVSSLYGISKVARNKAAPANGMVDFITSTYNTGWMHGDIKLATLSDTDAADVTGSELNTDPNFDSGVGIFTAATGTVTHSSGTITSTKNSGGTSAMTSSDVLTVGKAYYIEFEITATSPGYTHINSPIGEITSGQVGTHSGTFIAGSTTVNFGQNNGGSTSSVTFTRISIRLAEEDRSVNGNGLQVFGTVTKNPVATGADLVAYSGFSGSNYLLQPYNSDLNFGTGDFFATAWVKPNTMNTYNYVFDKSDSNGTNRFAFYVTPSSVAGGAIEFYTPSNPNNYSEAIPTGAWTHVAWARRSGTNYGYINGKLHVTFSDSQDLTGDSTAKLYVGTRYTLSNSMDEGSMALLRISATAPTVEQIKKIYEDEKFLFQEDAKATLYGTSDAVTALAYDDSTNLLHAGTSAGRSVFQGLRRVDNTTDAVGTAISAVNGMVVEE